MSTDTDAGNEDPPALYERDVAPVDRIGDLVLLVLTTVDADRLPHDELTIRVVALVEDHGEAFDVATDTATIDALDALGLLASVDYVEGHPHAPAVETTQLTGRGEQAAEALVAGLDASQQAAIVDAIEGRGDTT